MTWFQASCRPKPWPISRLRIACRQQRSFAFAEIGGLMSYGENSRLWLTIP
jgi:hypothetical protein